MRKQKPVDARGAYDVLHEMWLFVRSHKSDDFIANETLLRAKRYLEILQSDLVKREEQDTDR